MVQWEVTPNCNHNCLHCYNHWREKIPVSISTKNSAGVIKDVVNEIIASKVFAVNVTGGEPLMVIDQIAHSIEMFSKENILVTMNSNLTLLSRRKAQLLKKCGVKSILVSIPSGDSETCDIITCKKDSLSRIIKGISIAMEFGIRVFTNMVVSKINKEQLERTAEIVAHLGLTHFAATRASDPSENKGFSHEILGWEEFCEMQKTLECIEKKFGLKINSLEANPPCAYNGLKPKQGYKFCNAGKTVCTIGFEGTIKPCNRMNLSYGNIHEGLQNAWCKMEDWRSDKWIPKACAKCSVRSICGGGCKADAVRAFNDITMPDPLCTGIPIPKNQIETTPLTVIDTFQVYDVNKSLVFRAEEFGSICFLSIGNWTPVSNELSMLLQTNKTVTQDDVANALSVDVDDAGATIKFLLKKSIVMPQKP
jgi:radical SAM protein with 4Fe4S-binding SPASM domain